MLVVSYLTLFQVKAYDNDFGPYGLISYELFGDDMIGLFMVDKTTGALYAKDVLDRENKLLYEVVIKATDGGGKIGYTVVKIQVGDINDNIPMFLLKDYKVVVKENTAIDTVIAKVSYCFQLIEKLKSFDYMFLKFIELQRDIE